MQIKWPIVSPHTTQYEAEQRERSREIDTLNFSSVHEVVQCNAWKPIRSAFCL